MKCQCQNVSCRNVRYQNKPKPFLEDGTKLKIPSVIKSPFFKGSITCHRTKTHPNASLCIAIGSSGLRLSNLTPPGSRKYGTYAMGGNYNERSDAASPNSSSSSSNKGSSSPSVTSAVTLKPIPLVVKTPPVTRKVGRASPPLSGKRENFCSSYIERKRKMSIGIGS